MKTRGEEKNKYDMIVSFVMHLIRLMQFNLRFQCDMRTMLIPTERQKKRKKTEERQ